MVYDACMNKVLIATRNKGKLEEIKEVLDSVPCEFLSLVDLGIDGEVEENGETFEENAFLKAEFFYQKAHMPVIAEDSGILVDFLPGELGVKTRRWGKGENAEDDEWVDYFLERMLEAVPEERGARFVCCSVFFDGKEKKIFNGKTEGFITKELEAPIKAGLPLSSCFRPKGYEKVYSALSKDQKNELSHRGKALQGLKNYLFERFSLR